MVNLRWARTRGHWAKVSAAFEAASDETIRVTLKADEAELARRSEAQMRRVVEGSAQGIIVRNVHEVLYMNDNFAKLVGYANARECISAERGANNMIHPDDIPLVTEHLKARLAGHEVVSNYEFRLVRRDGSIVWVETRAAIADWDGQPASVSWISDVSQRKAMEEELLKSKDAAEYANRTKTEFLANMSHELRTPLNAIIGFSEVIKDGMFGPAGQRYRDYSRDIHNSGRHLLELINDVLDLAKLEAGKLELHEADFAIPSLVEDCLTLVRSRARDRKVILGREYRARFAPLARRPPRSEADAWSICSPMR